jgi:hypothetical protein
MRVITGILAVLALLASGCTQAAAPTVLPAPTAVSAGPTPGPTASATPTEIATDSESSVLDFIGSYMQLTEESVRSEEALEARREAFSDSCTVCADGADTAEQLLASGLEVLGGEVRYKAEVVESTATSALVMVTHEISAIQLVDPSGETVQSAPASPSRTQVFQLQQPEGGSWTLLSIEDLP